MLVYHESRLGVMAFKETTQYITAGSVSSYEDKNKEDAAFWVGSFSSLPTPPVSSLAEGHPDDTRTARGIGAAKQLRSGREGRLPTDSPRLPPLASRAEVARTKLERDGAGPPGNPTAPCR